MKTEMRRTFEVEVEGELVKFAVVLPTPADEQEGQEVYSKAWQQATVLPADGRPAFYRENLDRVARERGLWDDERQAKNDALIDTLQEGAKRLARGGIGLMVAKTIAVEMHHARQELRGLRDELARLEATSVEGLAEQARFNHFVAACTVREDTGERYFGGVEEMLGDDDPVVYPAGRELAALLYGHDADFDLKLPEAAFLVARGFATPENGRLRLHDRTDGPARIAG